MITCSASSLIYAKQNAAYAKRRLSTVFNDYDILRIGLTVMPFLESSNASLISSKL